MNSIQVAPGEDHPHYIVEQGESLWTIAEILTGDGRRWIQLAELDNSVVCNPVKDPFVAIPNGTKIWVPYHWLEEWNQKTSGR